MHDRAVFEMHCYSIHSSQRAYGKASCGGIIVDLLMSLSFEVCTVVREYKKSHFNKGTFSQDASLLPNDGPPCLVW